MADKNYNPEATKKFHEIISQDSFIGRLFLNWRVKHLLKNGADIEAKDQYENTALHRTAARGQEGVMALLIKHGADIDAKNDDEETPLHKSVAWGREDATNILINHGANINAKDRKGNTPLDRATIRNQAGTMNILKEAKAITGKKSSKPDITKLPNTYVADLRKVTGPASKESGPKTSAVTLPRASSEKKYQRA